MLAQQVYNYKNNIFLIQFWHALNSPTLYHTGSNKHDSGYRLCYELAL